MSERDAEISFLLSRACSRNADSIRRAPKICPLRNRIFAFSGKNFVWFLQIEMIINLKYVRVHVYVAKFIYRKQKDIRAQRISLHAKLFVRQWLFISRFATKKIHRSWIRVARLVLREITFKRPVISHEKVSRRCIYTRIKVTINRFAARAHTHAWNITKRCSSSNCWNGIETSRSKCGFAQRV